MRTPIPFVALAASTLAASSVSAATQPQNSQMPAVVVTATLSEQDPASTPAFSTVITAEELRNSTINSLPDLLRDTVGVNNQTDNVGRDELQIRGLDGRYTLILVDGKRVSSTGALWRGSDFDFSSVPISAIERVEIIRGPMSVLYGSDAIGGVINIITRQAGKEWHGSAYTEYRTMEAGEDGDQYRMGASAAGSVTERFSLSVSGEILQRAPWYRHNANDPREVPSLEEKDSIKLATTGNFELNEEQELVFDFSHTDDKRPYALYSYADFGAFGEFSDYSEEEVSRNSYGVAHQGNWSWGKTVTSIKLEDAEIDIFNSRYNAPQQRALSEENLYISSYASVEFDQHALTVGADFRDQEIEDGATYLNTGKVSVSNVALFAQDQIALNDSWILTLGGRLDNHEEFGSYFSPKTYLSYQLNDSVVLKGGIASAFKAPDAYQMSSEYRIISCGGSCFLSGNPDLDPETSTSFEFGAEIYQENWHMSIATFYNDLKDMIVAVYDATGPSREWSNIAKAKTAGLEIDSQIDLNDRVSLNGNLTWLDTESTDDAGNTQPLDFRPKTQTKLGLDWQVSQHLKLGFNVNHYGTQYYQGEPLPSYTRFDISAGFSLGTDWDLKGGIRNLTDVDLEEKDDNFLGNELGRSIYASVNYRF